MENNKKEQEELDRFSSYLLYEKDDLFNIILINNIDKFEYIFNCVKNNFDYLDDNSFDKKYVGIIETIDFCKNFLEKIDVNYKKSFEDKINNGTFIIYDKEDKESDEYKENGERAFARIPPNDDKIYVDPEDDNYLISNSYNNISINIPTSYRRFDSFLIIHEFFHTEVYNNGSINNFLNETTPIVMQYVLMKYMEDNNIDKSEFKEFLTRRYNDFMYSVNNLTKFLNCYNENVDKLNINVENNIKNNEYIKERMLGSFRYAIGNLCGICIYKELCDNKINYDRINKYINLVKKGTSFSDKNCNDIMNNLIDYVYKNVDESLKFVKEKHFENENVNQIK